MSEKKKVLVIGATGAMGQYVVPRLAKMGYLVDGIAIGKNESNDPNIRYFDVNAKDRNFMTEFLKTGYDGIVDFMVYNTNEVIRWLPFYLDRTEHYIFLSSYRVYDDKEIPIRETSPQVVDTADDIIFRNSDDYSVYKGRGEKVLRALPQKNWTIIRPAITYSCMRYQLVTLEMHDTVGRAFRGKTVVVPETAKDIQATMSWGNDVAHMISKLLFNDKALHEDFTVSTSEHHTWGEIADYYKDLVNMDVRWIPLDDYLNIRCADPYEPAPKWQLLYDRQFNRIMDNSKVLAATGIKQSDLISLYDGLKYEIGRCPRDITWNENPRMDAYLAGTLTRR